MAFPKITVIIPTRERCDVLGKALATVTAQDYDGLEILVSDNFSDDDTEEVVRSAGDPRIQYVNPGRRLSMSHHWEFALSHVKDGWVTIIGDDDGLLPGALTRASNLWRDLEVEALRSRVCEYSWPSLTGTMFGRLTIPLGSACEVRDSSRWLSRVLEGRASYDQLPMLYNGGFVKSSILDRLRRHDAIVYRSCSPDVYSAVAIASVLPRYGYSETPLAINGASIHSTGTSHFAAGGNTAPAKRFSSETNIPYHRDIPMTRDGGYPLSLQVAFYEAYLQSAHLRPKEGNRHGDQLEVVLAKMAGGDPALRDWAKIFATRHEIDFARASARAHWRKVADGLRTAPANLASRVRLLRLGSLDCPLVDVYEAALTAHEVLVGPPQRLRVAAQVLSRVWDKVTSRSLRTRF